MIRVFRESSENEFFFVGEFTREKDAINYAKKSSDKLIVVDSGVLYHRIVFKNYCYA